MHFIRGGDVAPSFICVLVQTCAHSFLVSQRGRPTRKNNDAKRRMITLSLGASADAAATPRLRRPAANSTAAAADTYVAHLRDSFTPASKQAE